MDDAKPQIRVNLLRSSLAVRDRKLKQHKLNQWQDITSQHLNIYYTLNLVKKNIKNTLKINFFCEIWNVLIKKHTNDRITFWAETIIGGHRYYHPTPPYVAKSESSGSWSEYIFAAILSSHNEESESSISSRCGRWLLCSDDYGGRKQKSQPTNITPH